MITITQAKDLHHGAIHNYPPLEEDVHKLRLRYDFIFTKEGVWYYAASSNNIDDFIKFELNQPVENNDEHWAIINNLTGEVIKTNLIDEYNMSLDVAKELAQQGVKMTHKTFTTKEWLIMEGNMIEFEDGANIFFDEWTKDKDYLLTGWSKFK